MAAAVILRVPADPFAAIASQLDAASLCCLDACCTTMRTRQGSLLGPWHRHGLRAFHGVEVDLDGESQRFDSQPGGIPTTSDWKHRCRRFHEGVSAMEEEDCEGFAATSRACVRVDCLGGPGRGHGLYVEVQIAAGLCGFSFGLRGGADGMSSLTFSPDSGIVQEIWLAPAIAADGRALATHSLKAAFRRTLPAAGRAGGPWRCGLYLTAGRAEFFRLAVPGSTGSACAEADRCRPQEALPAWETTGTITGMTWAEGHAAALYLRSASGSIGKHACITRVGGAPPC